MDKEYLSAFDIRYVKLHFTAQIEEDTRLPINKVSALRGGMGEMLLRANCVRDRNCEACDFETECIVRRTMYSKMEIQPAFMTRGDSVGYVLECEDYREIFFAGDTFSFNLILFGKTIVYFSQFLNAFYALGQNGLGTEKSRFRIIGVTNSRNESVLDGNSIYMKKYVITSLKNYIQYRENALAGAERITIKFQSPLSLKYKGEQQERFRIGAVMSACRRRVYMLDCFEGIECDLPDDNSIVLPEEGEESHRSVRVRRYSSRTDTGMELKGIEGSLEITKPTQESLRLLIAGELVHIGKNTSFGFGRYRLKGEG